MYYHTCILFDYLTTIKLCLAKKRYNNLDSFKEFLGEKQGSAKFYNREYLRHNTRIHYTYCIVLPDISILQFLKEKDEELVKERELFLDLMFDIDQTYHSEDKDAIREARIVRNLKKGLPTSPWLSDLIKKVQEKISWE